MNEQLKKLLETNKEFKLFYENLKKEIEKLCEGYVFDRNPKTTSELHEIAGKYLLILNVNVGTMPQPQAEQYVGHVVKKMDEKLNEFFGEGKLFVAGFPYRRN